MRQVDRPIDLGAIDDLAVGSDAILSMEQTPIPSHATIGVGGTEWADENLENAPEGDGDIYRLVRFLSDPAEIFGEDQHDLIVSRPSQAGGIAGAAQTVFEGVLSLHSFAPVNPDYAYRIYCQNGTNQPPFCSGALGEGLLNQAPDAAVFGLFPAPASVPVRSPGHGDPAGPASRGAGIALVEGMLAITNPAPGTAFASGEIVNIAFAGVEGYQPTRVLLLTPVEVIGDDTPPFEFALQLPDNFAGELPIAAIAEDANQVFTRLEGVAISVDPAASLTGIDIPEQSLFLNGLFDRFSLSVRGSYDDDIERDLTDPSTGTTYVSADPAVATVDTGGEVTARGDGMTVITAQNGNFQDSVTVEVDNVGDLLFFDGFES